MLIFYPVERTKYTRSTSFASAELVDTIFVSIGIGENATEKTKLILGN